jgi:hypothetical protein
MKNDWYTDPDVWTMPRYAVEHNAKKIYDVFQRAGWRHKSICAMLGNQGNEGIYDPGKVEGLADLHTPYKNKDGTTRKRGYGLTQWTPWTKIMDRMNCTEAEMMANGDLQVALIIKESKSGSLQWTARYYPGDGDMTFQDFLTGDYTLDELTRGFHRCYEISGDPDSTERIKTAREWDVFFGGSGDGGGSDPDPDNPNNPNPPNKPPNPEPDQLGVYGDGYPSGGYPNDTYFTFQCYIEGGVPPYTVSTTVFSNGNIYIPASATQYVSTQLPFGTAYALFAVRDSRNQQRTFKSNTVRVDPQFAVVSAYVNGTPQPTGANYMPGDATMEYISGAVDFFPFLGLVTSQGNQLYFALIVNEQAVVSGIGQYTSTTDGYTDSGRFTVNFPATYTFPVPCNYRIEVSLNTAYGAYWIQSGTYFISQPGQQYPAVNGKVTVDVDQRELGEYSRWTLTLDQPGTLDVTYEFIVDGKSAGWEQAMTGSGGTVFFTDPINMMVPSIGKVRFRAFDSVSGEYFYFMGPNVYWQKPYGGGGDGGSGGLFPSIKGSGLWLLKRIKQAQYGGTLPNA